MKKIAIVGASGHAKVTIEIIEDQGVYEIAGFLDTNKKIDEEVHGYKVLGKEDDLPELIKRQNIEGLLIAIGDNFIRSKVAEKVKALCPDIRFVSAIHPRAFVSKTASIGDGTVIMAGVVINASCNIGEFCILNTNSSFDHDSVMDAFSSLAPNVSTGGNCRIGRFSAINIGATLIHGIRIGEHTVVGAGSTVLRDVDSYCVSYGSPSVKAGQRKPGDKYL